MAHKSCALIGPGKGPKVQARTHGRVTVRGLRPGECAAILGDHGDGTGQLILVTENGSFEFKKCLTVEIEYTGTNKAFIACVITGERHAVHGS